MSLFRAANRTLRRNLPDAAFTRPVNPGSRVVPGAPRIRVERSGSRGRIDAGDAVPDILPPRRPTLHRHGSHLGGFGWREDAPAGSGR